MMRESRGVLEEQVVVQSAGKVLGTQRGTGEIVARVLMRLRCWRRGCCDAKAAGSYDKSVRGGGGLKAVGHTLQGKMSIEGSMTHASPEVHCWHERYGRRGQRWTGPCNGLVIVGLEFQASARDLSFSSRFLPGAVSEHGAVRGGGEARRPVQGQNPPAQPPKGPSPPRRKEENKRKQRGKSTLSHVHARLQLPKRP